MSSTHRALALALALAALAAPAASAQQDLRNADNRVDPPPPQDLRMPDRRAPEAPKPEPAPTYRDLRSADARDDRRIVTVTAPSAEPGFDVGDAAVGAGVIAGVIALAGTAGFTVRRHRVATAR
jgi:hypothetical protein